MATNPTRRLYVVTGMGVGATLMYLFDPDAGRGRRVQARDQLLARLRRMQREADRRRRYEAGIAEGRRHTAGPARRPVDDRALADRIRSELGPMFPHDRVTLNVLDGIAELRGQFDDRAAIDQLIQRVRGVSGVLDVVDLLHLPDQPAPTKEAALRASSRAQG